jgi:hypothetical protein
MPPIKLKWKRQITGILAVGTIFFLASSCKSQFKTRHSSESPHSKSVESYRGEMSKRLTAAIKASESGSYAFFQFEDSLADMSEDEVYAAAQYTSNNTNISSYFLLLALYQQAPEVYSQLSAEKRADIICDALKKLLVVNDFQLLESTASSSNYVAGRALLDIGEPAIPCLAKLLDNYDDVRFIGSEESAISEVDSYRRADYAYKYIMLILKKKPFYSEDPKERDGRIAALKAELEKSPR